MHAECDIMANLSICPRNASTVSKQMHILPHLFDILVGASFLFFSTTAITKFRGELPQWGQH